MAKIVIQSTLPLNDFIHHLELGGHEVILSENFFDWQSAEIFHFVIDSMLRKTLSLDELKALSFATIAKKKIAVSVRGSHIGIGFWPLIKQAHIVTVESRGQWLKLPAWLRQKCSIEIMQLPITLSETVDLEMLKNLEPYFLERRLTDFVVFNSQKNVKISIPSSIPVEHQQLLVERAAGFYHQGKKVSASSNQLSWDLIINHLNRLYKAVTT